MMTNSRRPTTCGLRSGFAFLSFSIPFPLQCLHLTVLNIQLPLTSLPPSITDCKVSSHVLPLLLPNTTLDTCPFPPPSSFSPSLTRAGRLNYSPDDRTTLATFGPSLRGINAQPTGRFGPSYIAPIWEGGRADYNRPRSGAAVAYSGPSSPPHTFIAGTTSLCQWID